MKVNNSLYTESAFKQSLIDMGAWDPRDEDKVIPGASPWGAISWGGVLIKLGEVLKERHDVIQYIIFEKKNASQVTANIFFKNNTMVRTHGYYVISAYKSTYKYIEIALQDIAKTLYNNWGKTGNLTNPLIMT